jgi:hypothetical protein
MWKITFFFSALGSTWTETYYSAGTMYGAIVSQCTYIAMLRVGMNARGVTLTAIRLVNLNTPRISAFLTPGTFASQPAFISNPGTDPDQDAAPAFVAVQVKFFGSAGNICRRYVSGAPEGIIEGGPAAPRNIGALGAWQNALSAFVLGMAQNSWSFRFTNQANAAACSAVLTNAQFPGEIGVQFQTQVVQPVVGKQVYIHLKGFRKVNYRQFGLGGNYAVDPLSPGLTASVAPYIYYLQNTPQVLVANIAQRGVGVQLVYGFDSFTATGGPAGNGYSILSANHRKRGVSALALRGRSRSKP